MTTGAQGIALIKKWEGLRTTAYQDVGGLWTIGYGHLITSASSTLIGQTITEAQAEALLRADLATAEAGVNSKVLVPLSQPQFDALVSLVFNIGVGAFGASTLLQRINAKAPESEIEAQWKRWNKVNGNPVQGLTNRRAAEWELFSQKKKT